MKDVPSIRHYTLVLAALMGLLVVTIAAAFLPSGPLATPIALLIAAAKAALVLLFFMHLKRSNGLNRLVAAVGFFWLAILLVLTLNDFLTRGG